MVQLSILFRALGGVNHSKILRFYSFLNVSHLSLSAILPSMSLSLCSDRSTSSCRALRWESVSLSWALMWRNVPLSSSIIWNIRCYHGNQKMFTKAGPPCHVTFPNPPQSSYSVSRCLYWVQSLNKANLLFMCCLVHSLEHKLGLIYVKWSKSFNVRIVLRTCLKLSLSLLNRSHSTIRPVWSALRVVCELAVSANSCLTLLNSASYRGRCYEGAGLPWLQGLWGVPHTSGPFRVKFVYQSIPIF